MGTQIPRFGVYGSKPRPPLSNTVNTQASQAAKNQPFSTWGRKDDSESVPSSEESIYNAKIVSSSSLTKSPGSAALSPWTASRPLMPIDLDAGAPLSRFEAPFLYGHGTELSPILERRSMATLRTWSLSESDMSSFRRDAPTPGNSSSSKIPLCMLRRQQSFSLDDRRLFPARRQEVAWELDNLRPAGVIGEQPAVHIADISVYPQRPQHPPHQWPVTPPSFSSVMKSQSIPNIVFRSPRSQYEGLANHPYLRRQYATAVLDEPYEIDSTRPYYLTRPGQRLQNMSWTEPQAFANHVIHCRECRRPRSQYWSLRETIWGKGNLTRRGNDWCSRCCVRKIVYFVCCLPLAE